MSNKHSVLMFVAFGLCVASKPAAACIDPTTARDYHKTKEIFDVGGSTFGASLSVGAGLWSASDLKALVAGVPGIGADQIPSDYARVTSSAAGDINFFGMGFTLVELAAHAKRQSGSFSKKFTIDVAGIDLYSGSNNLSSTLTPIGPYSQLFYTAATSYGVATARGKILGEIGMLARGAASASGLGVEGRSWAALVLEGSAGVSIGVAGVGLLGQVDLLEVGLDFNEKLPLSGGSYSFTSSYDATTLDGSLAIKASALGASTTLWQDSWNGHTLSTTPLYNPTPGCVR